MKKFVGNTATFIVSLIALIGGVIWAYESEWSIEPIIISSVAFVELIAFIIIKSSTESNSETSTNDIKNKQNVNVNVNVGTALDLANQQRQNEEGKIADRESKIDLMKSKTRILFIDDDKNFNVVKILKDSGWKKTKTVIDIVSIDIQVVKDSDVLFIDLNGVGKLLNLTNEGLDLALMLKQRYPQKKVGIYSANKMSNSFHEAWDICDFKLEKNALPNQFQNLVEEFSLEFFNNTQ